jgi:hypothetical protein
MGQENITSFARVVTESTLAGGFDNPNNDPIKHRRQPMHRKPLFFNQSLR